MTAGDLLAIEKEKLIEIAEAIDTAELPQLVAYLSEKDDNIRYRAFLLLQYRSRLKADVYPFWADFQLKLNSDNSYQRSIGMILLAENARWDAENRMDIALGACLNLLTDEKPITVRQCIQSLGIIAACKPKLAETIAKRLISVDLTTVKETMRKSVLLDIVHVLVEIRKTHKTDDIDCFLFDALSGDVLDRKSKKELEACL